MIKIKKNVKSAAQVSITKRGMLFGTFLLSIFFLGIFLGKPNLIIIACFSAIILLLVLLYNIFSIMTHYLTVTELRQGGDCRGRCCKRPPKIIDYSNVEVISSIVKPCVNKDIPKSGKIFQFVENPLYIGSGRKNIVNINKNNSEVVVYGKKTSAGYLKIGGYDKKINCGSNIDIES